MVIFLALLFLFTPLHADENQNNSGAVPEPENFIGMELNEAFRILGAPEEVFPLRGGADGEDCVVFFYSNYIYLYWYGSRVWQVSFDSRYDESVLGLDIGSERSSVIEQLGEPFFEDTGSLVFSRTDRGYPVRARLFFENDRLTEVYIYRSDF